MDVVLVYLSEESEKYGPPGVVGPFDSLDEAAEFGNWLRNQGAHWVKIAQVSAPPVQYSNVIGTVNV